MTVTELTKEIYEKYPKVWDKMSKEIRLIKPYSWFDITFTTPEYDMAGIIEIADNTRQHMPLPLNMLYGLLEDFFEDNGIIINTPHFYYDDNYQLKYIYCIDDCMEEYSSQEDDIKFDNRKVARERAILKACEILEGKL